MHKQNKNPTALPTFPATSKGAAGYNYYVYQSLGNWHGTCPSRGHPRSRPPEHAALITGIIHGDFECDVEMPNERRVESGEQA